MTFITGFLFGLGVLAAIALVWIVITVVVAIIQEQ
jgi:hypothetical protein